LKLRIIPALALAAALALVVPAGQVVRAEGIDLVDTSRVSQKILEQGAAKTQIQDRLATVQTIGGARPGEPIDRTQPSISGPLERGIIDLGPGTTAAFAYVQPYQEPNTWAYRNYCGPGAAIVLLSHWEGSYPARANIDALGQDMGLDPNMGVWVYRMASPINQRLNEITGQEVNWYRYGEAQTLDDLRYMLETDLVDHGIPLITSLMTRGLPGWGPVDVGHIVAIYGYTRTADGTEYVSYVDTAPPLSGHTGYVLHTWELNAFWRAVSRNGAQIW
jgi:hypothetical protein